MSGDLPGLLLFSGNAHKVREVGEILGPFCSISGLEVLERVPPAEETGATFSENADIKALAGASVYPGFVLADDSGLEVDALRGAPGVRSARFAGEDATDAANTALLLERLAGVRGKSRAARFRCVLSLARQGEVLAHFEGCVEGVIANAARGRHGFGYDPVFIPAGYCQTFGELPPETKHQLSHRGRALQGLREWFAEQQTAARAASGSGRG